MTFNKMSVCPGSVGTKGNHPLMPIHSPAEQPGPDCQPGSWVIQLPSVFLEAEEIRVLPEAEESLMARLSGCCHWQLCPGNWEPFPLTLRWEGKEECDWDLCLSMYGKEVGWCQNSQQHLPRSFDVQIR